MDCAVEECIAEYLMAEFGGHVSKYAIRRALVSIGWSRKQTRRVAQERNADLRDFHLRRLSEFSLYHLVYVDESGCDKRVGVRRTGWSPRGTAPVQVAHISSTGIAIRSCRPTLKTASRSHRSSKARRTLSSSKTLYGSSCRIVVDSLRQSRS